MVKSGRWLAADQGLSVRRRADILWALCGVGVEEMFCIFAGNEALPSGGRSQTTRIYH